MENGKYRKLIKSLIVLAMIMMPVFSYAYSDKTTHPALTNETVDIFNHYYPSLRLGEIARENILKGSEGEYSPAYRPINIPRGRTSGILDSRIRGNRMELSTGFALRLGYFWL